MKKSERIIPENGYYLNIRILQEPFSTRLLFAISVLLKQSMNVNLGWEVFKRQNESN